MTWSRSRRRRPGYDGRPCCWRPSGGRSSPARRPRWRPRLCHSRWLRSARGRGARPHGCIGRRSGSGRRRWLGRTCSRNAGPRSSPRGYYARIRPNPGSRYRLASHSGLSDRSHRRLCHHLCSGKLLWRYPHYLVRDWLSAAECVHGHRGRGNVSVHVLNVVYICHVVDVCDIRDIPHVGHVHLTCIVAAVPVPRHVRLTRTEREPSLQSATTSNTDTDGKTRSTHKGHQRRRVHRRDGHRARHPAPLGSDACPTAVVERRKTPRLVFNPRPAPGVDPGPAAVTIRHPVGRNTRWVPDGTVLRHIVPTTVRVEITVAGH